MSESSDKSCAQCFGHSLSCAHLGSVTEKKPKFVRFQNFLHTSHVQRLSGFQEARVREISRFLSQEPAATSLKRLDLRMSVIRHCKNRTLASTSGSSPCWCARTSGASASHVHALGPVSSAVETRADNGGWRFPLWCCVWVFPTSKKSLEFAEHNFWTNG